MCILEYIHALFMSLSQRNEDIHFDKDSINSLGMSEVGQRPMDRHETVGVLVVGKTFHPVFVADQLAGRHCCFVDVDHRAVRPFRWCGTLQYT